MEKEFIDRLVHLGYSIEQATRYVEKAKTLTQNEWYQYMQKVWNPSEEDGRHSRKVFWDMDVLCIPDKITEEHTKRLKIIKENMHPKLSAIKTAASAQKAAERYTTFSQWYKGDHARYRTALARTVKDAIKEFKKSDPELANQLSAFLDSHSQKNTDWWALADIMKKHQEPETKLTEQKLRGIIRNVIKESTSNRLTVGSIIAVGSEFVDPKGNSVTVKSLHVVLGLSDGGSTWIEYDFQTVDGRSGTEKNTLERFIKILGGAD